MTTRNRRRAPPRNFAEAVRDAHEVMNRDIDGPREPSPDEWLARVVKRPDDASARVHLSDKE